METKKASARIVTITPMPEETAYWNFEVMTNPNYPHEVKAVAPEILDKFFSEAPKHLAFLECINMNIAFEHVSRAFQQQLTRTRTASYSIQSLRMIDVGNFADEGNYYLPTRLTPEQALEFHASMKSVQGAYRLLVASGAAAEDARGVLPLNIHSPVHMTVNFRNLITIMEQRLCGLTQEEFRNVAADLRDQLFVVAPRLTSLYIKSSCEKQHKCVGRPLCHGWVR